MADREKVIKALELCAEGHHCHECSYQPVKHNLDGIADCTSLLADHALSLLKEQEAVEPDTDSEGTCSCGICGETVGYYPVGCNTPRKLCKFCPQCGKEVKWDG